MNILCNHHNIIKILSYSINTSEATVWATKTWCRYHARWNGDICRGISRDFYLTNFYGSIYLLSTLAHETQSSQLNRLFSIIPAITENMGLSCTWNVHNGSQFPTFKIHLTKRKCSFGFYLSKHVCNVSYMLHEYVLHTPLTSYPHTNTWVVQEWAK